MSRTKIPEPPAWVKQAGKEALWAWRNWLHWRMDAVLAYTARHREVLIAQAKRAHGK